MNDYIKNHVQELKTEKNKLVELESKARQEVLNYREKLANITVLINKIEAVE